MKIKDEWMINKFRWEKDTNGSSLHCKACLWETFSVMSERLSNGMGVEHGVDRTLFGHLKSLQEV